MKQLRLELNEKTYQQLKTKFKGDEKAICDFAIKVLNDELSKIFTAQSKTDSEKKTNGLEDYLKSGKPGSRSYGTKGQGW